MSRLNKYINEEKEKISKDVSDDDKKIVIKIQNEVENENEDEKSGSGNTGSLEKKIDKILKILEK